MKTPKTIMERILLPASLAAFFVACVACTVKEDRNPCPCNLTVSFLDPETNGPVELLGWDSEMVFRERVHIENNRSEWRKSVRKGIFTLSVYNGSADSSIQTGHEIRIPLKCQADSLYAYYKRIDATGDFAHAEVLLRKQFATVFLDFQKSEDVLRACRFLVEGNTCGFDILDHSPIVGPFSFEPIPVIGETVVTFRIPRQADDSLAIIIQSEDAPSARYSIGEDIRRAGYNWKAEELQDIYLSIDLVRGLVDLQVANWEDGTEFPLVEK